jgi:two-component system NtrC family sensor kinase
LSNSPTFSAVASLGLPKQLPKYKGEALSILGETFAKKGQSSLAKNAYLQSIKASLEVRNLQSLGNAYINLATLYRDTRQIDSSIFYTKKSLINSHHLHSANSRLRAYLSFYLNYKIQNNINSSYFYLDKATILNDSLVKVEKEKLKQVFSISLDEQLRLNELEKENLLNEGRSKLYIMGAGLFFLFIISLILYRSYQQKNRSNTLLNQKNDQVERALTQLKITQNQLIQKEKLASLGELTAGIAHEIQNPLNFVNNFAEVSVELADELHQSVEENDKLLAQELANDLRQNMTQIVQNGQRASNIVRAMLEHSQASTAERQPVQINGLAEEYLRLAYHGFRAKDSLFTATLHTDFQTDLPPIEGVVQDLSRVLLNLYNNAFYALKQRQAQENNNQSTTTGESAAYEPTLWVSTRLVARQSDRPAIELRVKDNGPGIPSRIQEKVFQPFFTTKPTGQGTGLGLSLSYDIITKGHGGEMALESQEGQGTEFIIRLPVV